MPLQDCFNLSKLIKIKLVGQKVKRPEGHPQPEHLSYRNDPKFLDTYTWANSANPDQIRV